MDDNKNIKNEFFNKIENKISSSFLNNYKEEENYTFFKIKKKNGLYRLIHSPSKDLKLIQKIIAEILENNFINSLFSYGFCKGKSIIDNAQNHIQKNFVFNIDLKDFFYSIDNEMIKSAFHNYFKLNNLKNYDFLLNLVLKFCTYYNHLPQGSPSSPIISNICCFNLDNELADLSNKYNISYSRYADDITFSGEFNIYRKKSTFRNELSEIIRKNKFEINDKKTSIKSKNEKQIVTGLVVNKKLKPNNQYVKNLRLWLHWWEKYDYDIAEEKYIEFIYKNKLKNSTRLSIVILGKLNFLRTIINKDSKLIKNLYSRFFKLILSNINEFKDNLILESNNEVLENQETLKSLGIDMINIAAYGANDEKLKAKFSFHVEDFIKNYNNARKNDESFGNLSEDEQNQLKYKVNFKTKNEHPENILRNFFIYQLKDNILSSVKSKDNKSITNIVKKLLDISNNINLSPVERTEAKIIYAFLTSDTISDKIVLKGLDADGKYVSEAEDHEEVLSILLSNTTINQLLEKHLAGLGNFIINTGSKVNSRKTIKLTDLLSKSNDKFKSASENIIANNTANIPSMFISEGELPSTADLEFSEYVDRVGRRGRLQVKISNKEAGNVAKLTDNFNKIYETHKFNEEVVDNLLISLFNTLDNQLIGTFKDEDLTRIQTEYLLLKKSRKSGDIKFKKAIELLNFIIEKDNEINNFKLLSDRFDKYIKSSALRYGFTSKTGDSHYEKIFKSLITPLDENQEVTERIDDPITQLSRMAEAIITGYITRKHMDLRLGKNRNEVLDLTISGKSSFKILRNGVETVDDKKYRIRTNNTDLFTNVELVESVENGTIPTFTLGNRFGVDNFRLPEILFFPSADLLDIKGYLAEVITALNPGINLRSFERELFNRFPSPGTEGSQIKYLVIRKEENNFKVAFQNAHSIIVNEQNNDLISRRNIAIDNIESFVNSNTLNDTSIGLSYESPHLKDENGESVKIKDLTWGELVDNLRLEVEALQNQNIQETGRSKGTNYADLKDYPLLSLFLMSSETTTNVNKSNQFSMAAYFKQPVTGGLKAPKVSINPYYENSLQRNKAVILAQQLVLISNSSTTDITPGNKAVIGSRFSTTGSISVSSSFDTMSTETSRNKDKEAEIKAKENSIIRELAKAKTLFNTDVDLTNNKNFWFLQNSLSSFISNDIDSDSIINLYKIFLAKKNTKDSNEAMMIGLHKDDDDFYFNGDDTIINELSKEEYYKLQEYVLENDFNNTFEDYEKFFKYVKSLDNSSTKT